MQQEVEVWKDVVGFEEYFRVSNFAQVFSKRSNRLLKQHIHPNGYKVVATKIGGRGGKNFCFKVHRLVAEAFLEPPTRNTIDTCSKQGYGKVLVCHKDNNKLNNSVENLKWGTYQDNSDDYVSCGDAIKYAKRGESNALSKLTQADVDYIRSVYVPRSKEFGCRAISIKFRLAHSTVSRILSNKSYKAFVDG